ncbi:MAG: tetratricopeptide repeat protein [Elusimicrobia bacterium]|nr:tetratricopeptide repeat protein [Elusimicrobiota bacterium]
MKKNKKLLFSLAFTAFTAFTASTAFCANWKAPARKGVEEYKKGDYQGALDSFKQAGQSSAQNPLIEFNKGCAAYKLNDMESASQSFRKAGETAKKDERFQSEGFYNLGNVFFQQGKMDQAVQSYKKALLLNPRDQQARHNLALALKSENQNKEQNKQDQQNGGRNENQMKENEKKQGPQGNKELEALLEAFEQEEMNRAKKMRKRKQDQPTTEYDW